MSSPQTHVDGNNPGAASNVEVLNFQYPFTGSILQNGGAYSYDASNVPVLRFNGNMATPSEIIIRTPAFFFEPNWIYHAEVDYAMAAAAGSLTFRLRHFPSAVNVTLLSTNTVTARTTVNLPAGPDATLGGNVDFRILTGAAGVYDFLLYGVRIVRKVPA